MCDLYIDPESCLQDEEVIIKCFNLKPNEIYTLSSHVCDLRSVNFFTYVYYRSNLNGEIDLSRDASIGGQYEGLFQMGLIASLAPAPHEKKYYRFFKRDVENANKIEIRLWEGKQLPEQLFKDTPLTKKFHFRHYMAPGVTRIPIKEGRVRATLFLPPGNGPFPGVIDMFGTAGGLLEFRAAQLASRGVAALALAFFGYDDLPKNISYFDIDYFRAAAKILLNYSQVQKPTVGVIGVSKGGDLALSVATFVSEVSAAACINGSCFNLSWPMKIDENHTIKPLPLDSKTIKVVDGDKLVMRRADSDFDSMSMEMKPLKESFIPIHESQSKFLFIVGDSDLNLNGNIFANIAAEHMDKAGKTYNYEIKTYEGAGHLIEPPYSPFCYASYHRMMDMVLVWGGEVKAHTEAQKEAWDDILQFFKRNLGARLKSKL